MVSHRALFAIYVFDSSPLQALLLLLCNPSHLFKLFVMSFFLSDFNQYMPWDCLFWRLLLAKLIKADWQFWSYNLVFAAIKFLSCCWIFSSWIVIFWIASQLYFAGRTSHTLQLPSNLSFILHRWLTHTLQKKEDKYMFYLLSIWWIWS